MKTTARRDGDDWVLNGRKIWISNARRADWTIVMARTQHADGMHPGVTAFLVDRGTPGLILEREIAMIGGTSTYELVLDECRIPDTQRLGEEGKGFRPMQKRLSTRRVEMAAWCIGRAQRALDIMMEQVRQRTTFGAVLADRQAIQWWIADAATRIHACRLMTYDAAARIDRGEDARTQVSMIKVFSTEMAWDVIDRAMQALGAMGMTRELPLQQMANQTRLMRIYEGPSEVHRWVVARNTLAGL
nr:acyl-CoA dehydrogenase [Verticiella sp. GG226]